MLKVKLQYFGRLMWRVNSLEKTLMLGEIESKKRRGRQRRRCWMTSLAQWRWIWANWETMENRGDWRAAVPGVAKNWKWLSNWTTKSEVCVTRCWLSLASLVAQTVKNLSVMWEPQVRSLGWEDPLGKGMATHSSVLAWRIPKTEEPGGLQSMGLLRVGTGWATNAYLLTSSQKSYGHIPHPGPHIESAMRPQLIQLILKPVPWTMAWSPYKSVPMILFSFVYRALENPQWATEYRQTWAGITGYSGWARGSGEARPGPEVSKGRDASVCVKRWWLPWPESPLLQLPILWWGRLFLPHASNLILFCK